MKISINQNNWAVTKLEDIATRITKGGTPTTYGYSFEKTGINFLKVENVKNGHVNLKSIKDFINEDAHNFQSKSQLSENDILFSIAGTIGETCVIRKEYLPANTNQALAIIKGTDCAIIPKLLENQLEAFVAKVKLKARGGAMNNVSLEDLKNLTVFIPPLPEQRAIVAKIEQLFSELDNAIANFKTAQQQLKVYRQAVLKKAFEGELTKEWRSQQTNLPTAEELLEQIQAERENHYQNQLKEYEIAVKKWEADKRPVEKKGKKPGKPSKPKELPPLTEDPLAELPGLPVGWMWVKFDDVNTIKSNLVSPKDFLTCPICSNNIQRETGQLLDYNTIEEDKVFSPKHYFFTGQIIYSKIRPNLNKLVIAKFDGLCSAGYVPYRN